MQFMWVSNIIHHSSSTSVWQKQQLQGLWGNSDGTVENCLDWKEKCVQASQIILLPASYICVIYTHAHPMPHLSLINESVNLRCSVERLPADTHFQIKSFTVESKEFSLSLHKHESNGGGGLQLDVSQFWHPQKVPAHLAACAVKFKCHFKPSKITCVYLTLTLSYIYLFRLFVYL